MNVVYNKDGIKVFLKTDGNGRVMEITGHVDNWDVLLITNRNGTFKIGMIGTPPLDLIELRRYITCYDLVLETIE